LLVLVVAVVVTKPPALPLKLSQVDLAVGAVRAPIPALLRMALMPVVLVMQEVILLLKDMLAVLGAVISTLVGIPAVEEEAQVE
jgi:hypothetical protein|tara:strand:+ start:85 stop:336 length:252 start_codon:yes stop_codon:yes gene_type:complete